MNGDRRLRGVRISRPGTGLRLPVDGNRSDAGPEVLSGLWMQVAQPLVDVAECSRSRLYTRIIVLRRLTSHAPRFRAAGYTRGSSCPARTPAESKNRRSSPVTSLTSGAVPASPGLAESRLAKRSSQVTLGWGRTRMPSSGLTRTTWSCSPRSSTDSAGRQIWFPGSMTVVWVVFVVASMGPRPWSRGNGYPGKLVVLVGWCVSLAHSEVIDERREARSMLCDYPTAMVFDPASKIEAPGQPTESPDAREELILS